MERKTEVSPEVISPTPSEQKESWHQSKGIIIGLCSNVLLLPCLSLFMLVNKNKHIRQLITKYSHLKRMKQQTLCF